MSLQEKIKSKDAKGAKVTYYDPYVPKLKTEALDMTSIELTEQYLKYSDGVVIATDHINIDYSLIADSCNIVLDTRNALKNFVNKK